MINAFSPISKNIHEPSRNKTVEIIGTPHRFLIFLPAKIPTIVEYIGFMAKNNTKQTAIPASPFTKVIASHGTINIINRETINQKIILLFIVLWIPPNNAIYKFYYTLRA